MSRRASKKYTAYPCRWRRSLCRCPFNLQQLYARMELLRIRTSKRRVYICHTYVLHVIPYLCMHMDRLYARRKRSCPPQEHNAERGRLLLRKGGGGREEKKARRPRPAASSATIAITYTFSRAWVRILVAVRVASMRKFHPKPSPCTVSWTSTCYHRED